MTPTAERLHFPWLALVAMLAVQVLASMVMSTAAVLSPVVAPSLSLPPERVGIFVAVAYLAAMTAGLPTGQWVARWGGVRVSQGSLLALGVGALLATVGEAWALLPAALCIGFGYGLANPTAAAVLARHVPAQSSGLFFSMKQAGVPLGVAVAGLCMPLGLGLLGWQVSVRVAALVCVGVSFWLWTTLSRLQPPGEQQPAPSGMRWWAPLQDLKHDRAMRRLGLVSLVYAMSQQGFLTFLVSLLHLEGGLMLASAAAILAASQLASTAARVGFGHLADRWMPPFRLLGWLGVFMSVGLVLLAWGGLSGHVMISAVSALLCGTFVMGWNGVFFAALVRSVPRERLANAAGATQFLTFTGAMMGPFLISQWVAAGGSFSQGLQALSLIPAVVGLLLLRQTATAAAAD
ncbi:MAG: MFS transporter [Limnohabitans sp.]|nr:MFS transporter [Limnohabitans sp.]